LRADDADALVYRIDIELGRAGSPR
jgi:hypothetical protein